MSSIRSFNMIRKHTFIVLCLLILIKITFIQSITINPNQGRDETSSTTTTNSKNWKPSIYRNNKEIKLLPTPNTNEEITSESNTNRYPIIDQKKSNLNERSLKSDSSYYSNSSPLSRTNEYGQRKNIENTSMKRMNLNRNHTKPIGYRHKESNKIEIKLLAQDETLESTTKPYRRRYRNKHNRNHTDKQEETNGKDGDDEEEKHTNDKRMINKNDDNNQNTNEETTTVNRLFNKNKRRLGNRFGNRINKDVTKVTEEVPDEENYKINLNVNKKVHDENGIKENNDTTNENDNTSIEVTEKSKEKTTKLIDKYKIPYTSTMETPIEIITTHKDLLNTYYYPDYNKNTLTNMQLLNSLGMRKIRQPNNHHYKRHQYQQQQETKSRSQYNNMNSDSQMYVVKLPPQPYYFINDKSSYNIIKPKNNLPITFNNNGKIDKVYHYNLPLVEKLMTGRKTYGNNKVQHIHDYNIGGYQNEYNDIYNKKQNDNEYKKHNKYIRNNETNLKYESSNIRNEYKKIIPVHEENTSSEENTDKSFDLKNNYKKFNDDYKNFNPTYEYKQFNEKELYDKFNPSEEFNKFNANDEFKLFDSSYDFNKFKSSDEFINNKYKFSSPSKGSVKHSLYDSNVYNIKPFQTSFIEKRQPMISNSDKYFRNYDRLIQSSSTSPIYMKPQMHRYYTNNGKPKSIYILPKYSKT